MQYCEGIRRQGQGCQIAELICTSRIESLALLPKILTFLRRCQPLCLCRFAQSNTEAFFWHPSATQPVILRWKHTVICEPYWPPQSFRISSALQAYTIFQQHHICLVHSSLRFVSTAAMHVSWPSYISNKRGSRNIQYELLSKLRRWEVWRCSARQNRINFQGERDHLECLVLPWSNTIEW